MKSRARTPATTAGRQRQDHRDGEMPGIGLAGQRIADENRQLREIDGDDREDRAKLNQNHEGRGLGQAEEMPGQQQMTGRAHRQEFGQAFDDAEDERNKQALFVHCRAVPCGKPSLAPLAVFANGVKFGEQARRDATVRSPSHLCGGLLRFGNWTSTRGTADD